MKGRESFDKARCSVQIRISIIPLICSQSNLNIFCMFRILLEVIAKGLYHEISNNSSDVLRFTGAGTYGVRFAKRSLAPSFYRLLRRDATRQHNEGKLCTFDSSRVDESLYGFARVASSETEVG